MDPPSKLWMLKMLFRKHGSCWARPVHIYEGITFWQSSTVQRNSPKKWWGRRQICCHGMTKICLSKSLANILRLQLKQKKTIEIFVEKDKKKQKPFGTPLQRQRGGVLESNIRNSSSTKGMGNQGKKHSMEITAQQLEEAAVNSKVKINIKETFNMSFPPIIPIEDLRNCHP